MCLQPTRNKKTSEQIGNNKLFDLQRKNWKCLNNFDSKLSQEWKYNQDEAPFICSNN